MHLAKALLGSRQSMGAAAATRTLPSPAPELQPHISSPIQPRGASASQKAAVTAASSSAARDAPNCFVFLGGTAGTALGSLRVLCSLGGCSGLAEACGRDTAGHEAEQGSSTCDPASSGVTAVAGEVARLGTAEPQPGAAGATAAGHPPGMPRGCTDHSRLSTRGGSGAATPGGISRGGPLEGKGLRSRTITGLRRTGGWGLLWPLPGGAGSPTSGAAGRGLFLQPRSLVRLCPFCEAAAGALLACRAPALPFPPGSHCGGAAGQSWKPSLSPQASQGLQCPVSLPKDTEMLGAGCVLASPYLQQRCSATSFIPSAFAVGIVQLLQRTHPSFPPGNLPASTFWELSRCPAIPRRAAVMSPLLIWPQHLWLTHPSPSPRSFPGHLVAWPIAWLPYPSSSGSTSACS